MGEVQEALATGYVREQELWDQEAKPIIIRRRQNVAYAADISEALLIIAGLYENSVRTDNQPNDEIEFEAAGFSFRISIKPLNNANT